MPASVSVTRSRPKFGHGRAMAPSEGVALSGGQDAGRFRGVRLLPGGHGSCGCRGRKRRRWRRRRSRTIAARSAVPASSASRARLPPRAPRPGFRRRGVGGEGGQRLRRRIGGIGRRGSTGMTLSAVRVVGAVGSGGGPERLAEVAPEGDEAVGRDQALPLQVGQAGIASVAGVGAKQDAVPARAQREALHVGKGRWHRRGRVPAPRQGRLRLDLDPGAILGFGGQRGQKNECQGENCDQPGEAGGPAYRHVVPVSVRGLIKMSRDRSQSVRRMHVNSG